MNQNTFFEGLNLLSPNLSFTQELGSYNSHLKDLFHDVPLEISDYFGYEYKLDKDEVPDLLICFHQYESLKKFIEIQFEHKLNADKCIHSINELVKVAQIWENKFTTQIHNIWLEFDSKDIFQEKVKYSFFYAPNLSANILENALVNAELYQCVMGVSLNKEVSKNLVHCYKLLIHGSYISQIGMMKARDLQGLRLFIQHVTNIPEYLESIDYPFSHHRNLLQLLDLGKKWNSQVELDIDITEKIQDKIGLEYYFSNSESALGFIKDCQISGYCDKNIFNKLKSETYINIHHSLENYSKCFSHFKINFHPELVPLTKAYIGYKKIQ